MTITIPAWLLWVVGLWVGIPMVIIILVLAYIGHCALNWYR